MPSEAVYVPADAFQPAHWCFYFHPMNIRAVSASWWSKKRLCPVSSVAMAAILDFFDFHASLYGESDISTQNASIMNRFLKMLESGTYREHREVTYYADCLCVTSKYLSEVSKKVSGYAANYWINRYTILDITRLLRDKSLTFVQISDMFGFSSPAYFSRYVHQNLGVKPSDYRE